MEISRFKVTIMSLWDLVGQPLLASTPLLELATVILLQGRHLTFLKDDTLCNLKTGFIFYYYYFIFAFENI